MFESTWIRKQIDIHIYTRHARQTDAENKSVLTLVCVSFKLSFPCGVVNISLKTVGRTSCKRDLRISLTKMDFSSFVHALCGTFQLPSRQSFLSKGKFYWTYLAIIRTSNKNNNNKIKTQRTAGFVRAWQNISRKIIWEGSGGQHISLSSL